MKNLLNFWEFEDIECKVNIKFLVEVKDGIDCFICHLSLNRALSQLTEDNFAWIVYLTDYISMFSIPVLNDDNLDYKNDKVECNFNLSILNEANIALSNLISISSSLENDEKTNRYHWALVNIAKWISFTSELINKSVYREIDSQSEKVTPNAA